MTIEQQNVINALYGPQRPIERIPSHAPVETMVTLPSATVAAIADYLDTHPDLSWDGVIQDAIAAYLNHG